MREIGGYIEIDNYNLPMIHEKAIALNCGRNALAYLIKAKNIKKIWIPKLICDSITKLCEKENVEYKFYSIGLDFNINQKLVLDDDDWLYFVNYYSQFDNSMILDLVRKYKRVIVDNSQSYFQKPLSQVDTLYTCRKYFGVSDGAFLYTDTYLNKQLDIDESYERMHFLLGRYEKSASEFYEEYVKNNELFEKEPIKKMSKLTYNLLHGIDYDFVYNNRIENYNYLHMKLCGINSLQLNSQAGSFMYPLLIDNGFEIKKQLHKRKIYIPTLWPDVFEWCNENENEYRMAANILPLPIDQRYGEKDMEYMIDIIFSIIDRFK